MPPKISINRREVTKIGISQCSMETKEVTTKITGKKRPMYRAKRREGAKRKKKNISTVGRYLGPLLPQVKSNLIYAQSLDLNPGASGAAAVQVFSCNGLYDPDVSGTGHQPRGFDQLIALYDHYVVIAAKITWRFGTTNASVYDQIACISVQDDTGTSIDPLDHAERAVNVMEIMPAGASGNTKTLSLGVNPNAFLGRSKPLSDATLKGSAAANPSEGCFFHCAVWPMQNVDAATVNSYVVIEYTAVFIEPKDVGSS